MLAILRESECGDVADSAAVRGGEGLALGVPSGVGLDRHCVGGASSARVEFRATLGAAGVAAAAAVAIEASLPARKHCVRAICIRRSERDSMSPRPCDALAKLSGAIKAVSGSM